MQEDIVITKSNKRQLIICHAYSNSVTASKMMSYRSYFLVNNPEHAFVVVELSANGCYLDGYTCRSVDKLLSVAKARCWKIEPVP